MLYDLKGVVTFSCFFPTLFTCTAIVRVSILYVAFNHGIIIFKKAQPKFYQSFHKIINQLLAQQNENRL